MKKPVTGLLLAVTLLAPAHAQRQPINQRLESMPAAARGVTYVAAVTDLAEHCRQAAPVIGALKGTLGRLAAYSQKVATRDDLVLAIRLGIQSGSVLRSAPGFDCSTYGPVVHAGQLPDKVATEMKRSPDPLQFESANIRLPGR